MSNIGDRVVALFILWFGYLCGCVYVTSVISDDFMRFIINLVLGMVGGVCVGILIYKKGNSNEK